MTKWKFTGSAFDRSIGILKNYCVRSSKDNNEKIIALGSVEKFGVRSMSHILLLSCSTETLITHQSAGEGKRDSGPISRGPPAASVPYKDSGRDERAGRAYGRLTVCRFTGRFVQRDRGNRQLRATRVRAGKPVPLPDPTRTGFRFPAR